MSKNPNTQTARNTELSYIHIHLITNLVYKNDHTSKNSVGSLKLGYNLQNVIQTNLKIIVIVSTEKETN
jgi:purine nucleoside phosphorylase